MLILSKCERTKSRRIIMAVEWIVSAAIYEHFTLLIFFTHYFNQVSVAFLSTML